MGRQPGYVIQPRHHATPPRPDPSMWDDTAAKRIVELWSEDYAAGRAPCCCEHCKGCDAAQVA